ncbi:MAG TPA: hypothetical protein VI386_21925 [Candidatus Sulfotelmatobacter sp.]
MARADVSEVGEFEINVKYIDRMKQMNPDVTFVISGNGLAACGMNSGTGKYGPIVTTGENWGWHFIRPQQFKPSLGSPEGQAIAVKACGEAAKTKLNRPNFDHYSFFMPREIPRVVTHYTAQQAKNMAEGEFHMVDDRDLPVAPYDIEVQGTEFYKTGGIDLTGVSVLCLFNAMLEIKAVKTMDVKEAPSPSRKAK